MKLDYLENETGSLRLIRPFAFEAREAARLQAAVMRLALEECEHLKVHGLPEVESVAGCRLTFLLRSWDQAAVRLPDTNDFTCGFTAGTWDNVAGLIEPFANGGCGFQWLAGVPGEACMLHSPSGQW